MPRASYAGVAVAVPVTVPYRRYSTHGAHWFIGQALEALVERSGIAKERIDAAAGQGGVSALGTLTSAAELSAAGELSGSGTLSGAGGLTRAGELTGPDPGALAGIAGITPPPVLKPRAPAASPASPPSAAPKGDDDGA